MECINRSMENNLLAAAMIRNLEQAAQQDRNGAVAFPEIRETRAQRRARERAENKAHIRAMRASVKKAEVA